MDFLPPEQQPERTKTRSRAKKCLTQEASSWSRRLGEKGGSMKNKSAEGAGGVCTVLPLPWGWISGSVVRVGKNLEESREHSRSLTVW